ncbi:MAG: DUF1996 domain-containing protein [Beutenbergiaceae bacterium]
MAVRRRRRVTWLAVAAVLVLAGCGLGGEPAQDPPSTDPAGADPTSTDAPPADQPHLIPGIDPFTGSGTAANELLRETTSSPPVPSGTGEVRITCGVSHYSYDDPIVFPGEPGASHLHTFLGNAGTDAYSTYESLRDEPAGSTCAGGSANKSAYWTPSLIDADSGTVVEPTLAFVYYKTGYWGQDAESIQDIPNGLRMISGDATADSPQPDWQVRWTCATHNGDGVPLETLDEGPAIVDCDEGQLLDATVMFPQCWNGVDLDSADHQSHLAHPEFDGSCPSGYPVLLPQITLHMTWALGPGGTEGFYLSNDMMTPDGAPPGQGLHADFMDAWTPELRESITINCLRQRLDCGVRNLGDGYDLVDP